MSQLRFRGKNHPQQVKARGADDTIDDRWTPLNLWIPWNDRYRFTLDAAASHDNHLCDRYYTLEEDGLKQSWKGERVWCNPPYSDVAAWVKKAWDAHQEEGAQIVVMLVPANRTEQRWWQEDIELHRDRNLGLRTEFLPKRINFASKDNLGAWYASSAPFGCARLVWDALDVDTSDCEAVATRKGSPS